MASNDYPRWFFRKRERDCPAATSGVAHRKSLPPSPIWISSPRFHLASRDRSAWRFVRLRQGGARLGDPWALVVFPKAECARSPTGGEAEPISFFIFRFLEARLVPNEPIRDPDFASGGL